MTVVLALERLFAATTNPTITTRTTAPMMIQVHGIVVVEVDVVVVLPGAVPVDMAPPVVVPPVVVPPVVDPPVVVVVVPPVVVCASA